MAEAAKNYFDNKTLIPVSLVLTFMMLLSGAVVSYTTLATKVERLEQEMARANDKFQSKEMFNVKFDQIQADLTEIKTLLKDKK